jgi:hypothetical protein
MRFSVSIALAGALIAAGPAYATNAPAAATTNDVNAAAPAAPAANAAESPAATTPADTGAAPAPTTEPSRTPASFPWGVLGALGLIGLLGRRRSS